MNHARSEGQNASQDQLIESSRTNRSYVYGAPVTSSYRSHNEGLVTLTKSDQGLTCRGCHCTNSVQRVCIRGE